MMRKFLLYILLALSIWLFLSWCLIMRKRWSDSKAKTVFASKNVSLNIYDTIINNHHLHYAVSGSGNLSVLVFIHGSPGSWMNYMKFKWDSALRKKTKIVSIDKPGFGYSNFGKARIPGVFLYLKS